MSWSAHAPHVRPSDPSALEHLELEGQDSQAHRHQLAVGRKVARDVINSGAVGDQTKRYSVHLSGHGNPAHQPVAGWANDCVTVTVVQLSEGVDA